MQSGVFITNSLSSWALNCRSWMCLSNSEPIQASSSDKASKNDILNRSRKQLLRWSIATRDRIQAAVLVVRLKGRGEQRKAITWKFPSDLWFSKIIGNLQTLEKKIRHERNVEKGLFTPHARVCHQVVDFQVFFLLIAQIRLFSVKQKKSNQRHQNQIILSDRYKKADFGWCGVISNISYGADK